MFKNAICDIPYPMTTFRCNSRRWPGGESVASSKEYLQFILGYLAELEGIMYRAMMGELIIYLRGLMEWDRGKGHLMDTCLTAQDKYETYLDYFRIAY